jgi:hypothetical protein
MFCGRVNIAVSQAGKQHYGTLQEAVKQKNIHLSLLLIIPLIQLSDNWELHVFDNTNKNTFSHKKQV